MLRGLRSRSVPATIAAAFMAVLLAGQALAVPVFGSPIVLSASGWTTAGDMATTADHAYVVYEDNSRVLIRSSDDGGVTWSAPRRLSRGGMEERVAARGSAVDVVWTQDGQVMYQRSTDAGATFTRARRLTPLVEGGFQPDVARGADGLVVVTWTHSASVWARTSIDGGATFGARHSVATSNAWLSGPRPVLALAGRVIHVAFFANDTVLKVSRSTDLGKSWSAAARISGNASWRAPAGLVAAGDLVLVAYGAEGIANAWIAAALSTDRGLTWSSPMRLTPRTGVERGYAALGAGGGMMRVIYEQCVEPSCVASDVYYRQSANGVSWSAPVQVTDEPASYEWPGAVGLADGNVIVLSNRVSAAGYEVRIQHGAP